MKKQFFVLGLALFPFLSQAQFQNAKQVELGFTLTPNVGWLRINEDTPSGVSNEGSRAGFSYGILADFGLANNNNYFFSTAFALTSVNSKARVSSTSGTANYLYKLQYIEVPLTVKLKSNPGPASRVYGQFGLGTGIKIGAKRDIESGFTSAEKNVNITKDINILRLALIAGGGVEWRIDNNMDIQTGITFNNGFTDIFDSEGNARNSYFALNLGIFF